MDLLIDECVPRSAAEVFAGRNHTIRYVQEELGQRTPDRIVAETANQHGLILVTWNVKDFRSLGITRKPADNNQRYRKAGMISFILEEHQGKRRAEQVMESIEFEYRCALQRRDKRLLVAVYRDRLTIFY